MPERDEKLKELFDWVEKYYPLKTYWDKCESEKGEEQESMPYSYFKGNFIMKMKELFPQPTLNEEKLREVLENVFPEVFPSFYHRLHWLDKIFKALKTREKDIIE